MFSEMTVKALLDWGEDARRDLPWRRTRDPWAILVSELMLQQTQVTRVVPRYHAFLERFPTPAACAAAGAGSVIESWAGLGYNRRALNLHRAAVAITEHHDGSVPRDLTELLALPGIGPYTARAVLVFAHERDLGVVDVNVGRLLARWTGRQLGPREAQAIADELVPDGHAWRWTQTLFDLGATHCTARAPACDGCPASPWCTWRGDGPDPASGSAATSSKQSRFEGSDRQGRGRLISALRRGPVLAEELPAVVGWPAEPERARRVAADLVEEGLVRDDGAAFRLPR